MGRRIHSYFNLLMAVPTSTGEPLGSAKTRLSYQPSQQDFQFRARQQNLDFDKRSSTPRAPTTDPIAIPIYATDMTIAANLWLSSVAEMTRTSWVNWFAHTFLTYEDPSALRRPKQVSGNITVARLNWRACPQYYRNCLFTKENIQLA